jgi:hypothetical protein
MLGEMAQVVLDQILGAIRAVLRIAGHRSAVPNPFCLARRILSRPNLPRCHCAARHFDEDLGPGCESGDVEQQMLPTVAACTEFGDVLPRTDAAP